jgi:hypothetical protein
MPGRLLMLHVPAAHTARVGTRARVHRAGRLAEQVVATMDGHLVSNGSETVRARERISDYSPMRTALTTWAELKNASYASRRRG